MWYSIAQGILLWFIWYSRNRIVPLLLVFEIDFKYKPKVNNHSGSYTIHIRYHLKSPDLNQSDNLITGGNISRAYMIKKVLVAVDGSPEADTALLKVMEYLNPQEIELHAIYVISPSKYATIEGAAGYEGISNTP